MNATVTQHVNVTHLLASTGVTLDDARHVAQQYPAFRDGAPLLVVTGDQLYAHGDDASWASSALKAAAFQRRETRVEIADQALAEAHEQLLAAFRSRRGADWNARMLAAFNAVTAALLELIDAKEAAGRMLPAVAAELRVKVTAHQGTTHAISLSSARQALRIVRAA